MSGNFDFESATSFYKKIHRRIGTIDYTQRYSDWVSTCKGKLFISSLLLASFKKFIYNSFMKNSESNNELLQIYVLLYISDIGPGWALSAMNSYEELDFVGRENRKLDETSRAIFYIDGSTQSPKYGIIAYCQYDPTYTSGKVVWENGENIRDFVKTTNK